MNLKTFEKGFRTDYSNMGGYTIGIDMGQEGDGVTLCSAVHPKPSIFSKWYWIGLYMSILGFKFNKGALEKATTVSFSPVPPPPPSMKNLEDMFKTSREMYPAKGERL